MTTVLLVDDHPVVREGLRGMIDADDGLTVVGEAGSGAEAIALAESLRPDVILMDLRMPDVDGVTATERILTALPSTRIVVVTTYESDTDILRAVEAGAAGYLLKDASRAELADAVRDAARGKTVLAPTGDSAQSGTRPPLPSCRPSSSASMCSKSARISVTDSLPRRHRKVDNQRGPGRRTVHRHRSAERVDSVSQAEQSGTPGEIGAADAVVGY